ncbi:MAG: site-specific recombinase [Microbacteriaceae bacterium]|nr:site-specific recombinase [Microbacteriaceae bacterium]
MRAALYTRISEDDGTALGITRQEQDTRTEAERRGWEVVRVYSDNDVSATRSKRRPEYERLLSDIRSGVVNALVIWDADRLTRTPREGEDLIELVETMGLHLANVTGSEDLSTSDGRLVFRIKVAVARREVEQMSKRLKRKFEERAHAGKPHGQVPYGFRRVDGRDVAEPAEAAVIQEAARRLLAGDSLRSIVGDLNARNISAPRSATWSSAILRQMLMRSSLAGLRQYQGKVVGPAESDAVISKETHERLVALLTDPTRRTNRAGSEHRHLLSGIARCGREGCDGFMYRQPGAKVATPSGGEKRKPDSYACGSCFKVRRKQDDVDATVEEWLLTRLAEPDAVNLFPFGNPVEAQTARDQLEAIDSNLDFIMDELRANKITRRQFDRGNTPLHAEREVVERRLRAALPRTVVDFDFNDVMGSWDKLKMPQKRALLEIVADVTILPSGSGRRFDRDLIVVQERGAA